jgi:hypothetical protein
MDRKPDNGCEIQNMCCAKSGVMLRLRLVKSLNKEQEYETNGANAEGLLHGTKICLYLVEAYYWSDRVVCGLPLLGQQKNY